jgi:hypothetical protein
MTGQIMLYFTFIAVAVLGCKKKTDSFADASKKNVFRYALDGSQYVCTAQNNGNTLDFHSLNFPYGGNSDNLEIQVIHFPDGTNTSTSKYYYFETYIAVDKNSVIKRYQGTEVSGSRLQSAFRDGVLPANNFILTSDASNFVEITFFENSPGQISDDVITHLKGNFQVRLKRQTTSGAEYKTVTGNFDIYSNLR